MKGSDNSVPRKLDQVSHYIELNGGAWKVAAADFFCAMMALFMVLWIIGQDEASLSESVQLFQNPFRYMESGQSSDSPIDMGGSSADTREAQSGKSETGLGDNSIDYVKTVVQEFLKYLNVETDAEDAPVKVTVTSDGLRLAVFNRDHKPLFEGDSTQFTPWGNLVMQNISWITEQHPMRIRIDAHIGEELEESEQQNYGPWELSSDRANAVRRALVYYALDPKKIERVTGFGSANPKQEDGEGVDSVSRIEISMAP